MEKILYWLSVIRSYIFCFRYMPREIAIHCPHTYLLEYKVLYLF